MDMKVIFDSINIWYNKFIEWYLVQPIYGQIFAIIGNFVLLALAVILIYYIIKGIAYLVFYIIKGVYYLLKGIGFGFFKLFEGFYNLVSGKRKSQAKEDIETDEKHINTNELNVFYCSECGRRFTKKMNHQLAANGIAFCVNCGKQFRLINALDPIISTYT